MVFQHFNLFNNKTILENITLAPVQLKIMTKDRQTQRLWAFGKSRPGR